MPPPPTLKQITKQATDYSTNAPQPARRRPRKTAQNLATEKELISEMIMNGIPFLEIRIKLELTEAQLRAHLAKLLREGFHAPPPRYEAIQAQTLPQAIRRKLHAQPHDLIKCEGDKETVTLRVI